MLLTDEKQRSPATNSGLAKVAVQCFVWQFFVNLKCVLRMNICAKNRHLRQAANRYWQMQCVTQKVKVFRTSKEKKRHNFLMTFLSWPLFFSFRCAELKWPNCVKKRFFPRTTFDKCVFNEMLSEIFIENHMNPAFEKFTNFKNILFCMRLTTTLLTTIMWKHCF